jgi:hypothetical protein
VLPAAGLGVDIGQCQDAHRRRGGALRERLAVIADRFGGRGERRQNRQRDAGTAARGVDLELRRGAKPLDARAVLAPLGQPLLPEVRLLRGKGIRREAGAACLVFVDPRPEVRRREPRKGQQQVREIPLRIDRDGGDAVDRGFFDERQAQAGLAAAGHPDADRMGQQVPGVVEHRRAAGGGSRRIGLTAKIEDAELLEVSHDDFDDLVVW